MFIKFWKVIFVLFFLLYCVIDTEAKTVLTEKQLKENINSNKISMIYLVDGGIGGMETNQEGHISNEFIVFGEYEKIPGDIYKLARDHNVSIAQSQRFYDQTISTPSRIMPIVLWAFYIIIFLGILISLFRINRKLSKILEILINKE